MPRAFDTAQLVALGDPNRSDLNIRDPRLAFDLVQMLIDGAEWIFDTIVSEFAKLLGFDVTVFLADVHHIVSNLELLFGSLNPLSGEFNILIAAQTFIDIIKDALITLPMHLIEGLPAMLAGFLEGEGILGQLISAIFGGLGIGGGGTTLEHLTDGLFGWVQDIPIIGDIVEALTGIPGTLVHLAQWAIGLLTGESGLFAGNLFGQIGAGIMGLIPGSHIAEVSPNLLTDGDFPDAASLDGDEVWTWDGANGHTAVGCASVTCNGVAKDLFSDMIPVAAGQVLAGSGWVMWSGLPGGSTPIKLALTCYENTGTSSRPEWSVIGTPTLIIESSGLSGSNWRELSGSYTVPDGVDAVRLRPHIDATATTGTVKWDDLSLTKTQKISRGLIDGLDDLIGGIWQFFQDIIDGIVSAVRGVPFVGGFLADMIEELENLVGLGNTANNNANTALGGLDDLLQNLLTNPGAVLGELADDIVPGVGSTLAAIWNGITGQNYNTASHAEAQSVLEQSTQSLTAAQNEIAIIKQALTSGVAVNDQFNRSGAIGSNWAAMPVGSSVDYPHSGSGGLECDGNNLAWNVSGNTPHTKLVRYIGATGQYSNTQYQAVGVVLSSRGEDPWLGTTSRNQLLARVSDDGLNYLRLQVSAYAGNNDTIQLFYCLNGVETRLYVGGYGQVPGGGTSIYLLAGLKGSNPRTHTVVVNNNPIVQITESTPVSWLSTTPNTMGWGGGLSAGDNIGIWPFVQQAVPGKVNVWMAQDQ